MLESASWGGVPGLGGVLNPGGVLSLGGCVPGSGGVSGSGGCLLWGVSALGGVSAPGGLLQGGLLPGGGIPACTEADTPPVNRMTDRCKNITLATTSLRLVIIRIWVFPPPMNVLTFHTTLPDWQNTIDMSVPPFQSFGAKRQKQWQGEWTNHTINTPCESFKITNHSYGQQVKRQYSSFLL